MKKEPSSFVLIFSLAFTALLSGVLLSVVYAKTDPIIQRNKAEAIKKAIFNVLPDTKTFETYELKDKKLVLFKSVDGELPKGKTIYKGYFENGEVSGYAIPAIGPGFQDNISILYGYHITEQMIGGMEVLASKETPGLGDKIYSDKAFTDCFLELKVTPKVVANKKGPRSELNQVDTISGATISSVAIIRIINKSISEVTPLLDTIPHSTSTKSMSKEGSESDE